MRLDRFKSCATSASLSLVAALPKLRHLTREEAARRLGVTLGELDETNSFALVTFADPDPEFTTRLPTAAEREAARERIQKKRMSHHSATT